MHLAELVKGTAREVPDETLEIETETIAISDPGRTVMFDNNAPHSTLCQCEC